LTEQYQRQVQRVLWRTSLQRLGGSFDTIAAAVVARDQTERVAIQRAGPAALCTKCVLELLERAAPLVRRGITVVLVPSPVSRMNANANANAKMTAAKMGFNRIPCFPLS
jgi:hypothetical protein